MSSPRDLRVSIYAGFDFVMAVVYAVLLFAVVPNRHLWGQLLCGALVAAAALMGVAMVARTVWSWWLGAAMCATLLALTGAFLVLIVISAAFLAGVFGAFGQAASLLALIVAALVIELVGLLPALQLKFLMTRAGQRAFGKEPAQR